MTPEIQFVRGFVLVKLLHIAPVIVFSRLPFPLLGITQLVYVVPMAWLAYKRHEIARLQGILTAAVITVLVTGACYIMFVRPLLQRARHYVTLP